MRTAIVCFVATASLVAAARSSAAIITYDVTNVAGNSWRYDYTVENDAATPIEELSIFFDVGLYAGLSVAASPADWDSIVVEPDLGIPDDGFFDSLGGRLA